jgi:peptidoglycan/LPS O-acetylase OafA/YrhL
MSPVNPDYRNDIQGLRTIAVGLVVLYHAGLPLPGGFVGVDIFFVISGYVITLLLLREFRTAGRIDLGRFFVRRILRLTPALALTITVTLIISSLLLSPLGPQQIAAQTGLAALGLLANLQIARLSGEYFAADAAINPLLHLWSLSVEEQFYLAFPLLFAGALSLGTRLRRPLLPTAAVLMALAVTSYAWMAVGPDVLRGQASLWLSGYYSPLTRAWEFAAGALAAIVGRRNSLPDRMAFPAAVLGLGGLAASALLISEATPFPGPWTLLPVLATVLLLPAGQRDHALTRLLGSRLFQWIGDRSYGWYLWHWPLIVFSDLLWPEVAALKVTAGTAALAVAALSYRFVEQPLRGRAGLPPLRALRPVAALLAAAALTALLSWAVADQFWRPRLPDPIYAREDNSPVQLPDNLDQCFGPNAVDPPPMCVWHNEQTGTPVYLVGDSNAGMLREGLIPATAETGRPFGLSNTAGCAFLPHLAEYDLLPRSERCRNAFALTQRRLADAAPGLVVVAMSERLYALNSPGIDHRRKTTQLEQSLDLAVASLHAQGHQVLLVLPTPNFFEPFSWDPDRCLLSQLRNNTCIGSIALAAARADAAALHTLMVRVAAANGAAVIDIADQLCPDGQCLSRRGDDFIFADSGHITFEASVALAPFWRDVLRER